MNLMRPTANSSLALAALAVIAAAPAAALAQTAPASVPVAPIPSPLAQIPGVTVQYYDVTGATIKAMRASIDAQRPKDPVTGKGVPTSSKWSIGTSLKKQTTGTACKITTATATFKGEVVMPRLVVAAVTEETPAVPKPVMAEWQRFVTSLEQQQAAHLRQIHDRLPEVERAVMASSCEGASAAANKAISEISKTIAPVPAVPAR